MNANFILKAHSLSKRFIMASSSNKKTVTSKKENNDEIHEAANEKNQSKKSHKKYEDIHFVDSSKPVWNYSLFTEEDIRNFQNGTHYRLYELFGNKQLEVLDTKGTYFAV